MEAFGFIGFGSMAKMLIHALIAYARVNPSDILVTRRDKTRLDEIRSVSPDIAVAHSPRDVAANARCVFLCVKPHEVRNVLLEIQPHVRRDTYLVSIAGPVMIRDIAGIVDCKISKVIPTVISEIGTGVSLVCHGPNVLAEDERFLHGILGRLGKIKITEEKDMGFATEFTSCGPGLIASIFDNMVRASRGHGDAFTDKEIAALINETLYGTAKLLLERNVSYPELIERVAVKGGITQEGVSVFDEKLPEVFREMFEKTLGKRSASQKKIEAEFRKNG